MKVDGETSFIVHPWRLSWL